MHDFVGLQKLHPGIRVVILDSLYLTSLLPVIVSGYIHLCDYVIISFYVLEKPSTEYTSTFDRGNHDLLRLVMPTAEQVFLFLGTLLLVHLEVNTDNIMVCWFSILYMSIRVRCCCMAIRASSTFLFFSL